MTYLEYLKETIAKTYKKDGFDLPSIHGVSFMSKTGRGEVTSSKLASSKQRQIHTNFRTHQVVFWG